MNASIIAAGNHEEVVPGADRSSRRGLTSASNGGL